MEPLLPVELSGVWGVLAVESHPSGDLDSALSEIDALEASGLDGVRVVVTGEDDGAWFEAQRALAGRCTARELPWRIDARASDPTRQEARVRAAAQLEPAAIDVDDGSQPGSLTEAARGVGLFVDLRTRARGADGARAAGDWLRASGWRAAGVVGARLAELDEDVLDALRPALVDDALAVSVPAVELATARRLGATVVEGALAGLAPAGCERWWRQFDPEDHAPSIDLERRVLRWLEGALRPAARRAGIEDPLAASGRRQVAALLARGETADGLRAEAARLGLARWLEGT